MKESWQDEFTEIARTEMIKDSLNPAWVKKAIVNYNFETIQKLRFEIRDEDGEGYDFLGFFKRHSVNWFHIRVVNLLVD